MPRLKVPDGIGAVSHGNFQFTPDDAGIIDTADAPAEVVDALIAFAKCREATDEDVEKADLADVVAQGADGVKAEKAAIKEELTAAGVQFDGRTTIKGLRKLLEASKAAKK